MRAIALTLSTIIVIVVLLATLIALLFFFQGGFSSVGSGISSIGLTASESTGDKDQYEADHENARAAWNWALKQKNYTAIGQLLRSLSWFCAYRSRNQERKELFQQAREQLAPGPDDEPHPVWGRILAAEFFARPSEVDRAQIERSLAIAHTRFCIAKATSNIYQSPLSVTGSP